MLYLIKSPKWTRHYKKDTYWGTKQCGYVTVIADAGFYEDEEAHNIIRRSGKDGAELVPVTEEILDKAGRQLRKIRKNILKDREQAELRHNEYMSYLDKKEFHNNESFDLLAKVASQLGI